MPYRETTKPFEMADFYKYSTKYRKAQSESSTSSNESPRNSTAAHPPELPARPSHPQSPAKGSLPPPPPPPPPPPVSVKKLPHPPDSGQSDTDSVGEAFSSEMLAWYNTQQKSKANGSTSSSSTNKPATLVWEKRLCSCSIKTSVFVLCPNLFSVC